MNIWQHKNKKCMASQWPTKNLHEVIRKFKLLFVCMLGHVLCITIQQRAMLLAPPLFSIRTISVLTLRRYQKPHNLSFETKKKERKKLPNELYILYCVYWTHSTMQILTSLK